MKALDILRFMGFYWQTFLIILTPIIFLPIILLNDIPASRCFYTVCVMAIYWMVEVFPLGITALMPVFLFPALGIMDSFKTCYGYMKETTVMFIGGLMIAVIIEHCNLHTRIALVTIKIVGCSPKRLNAGLNIITCLISWWIVNTAATAMMIPIVQAILMQLEEQGFGSMYKPIGDIPDDVDYDEVKQPTKLTKCMFISMAYASNIGGIGTLVGTGTNLTFKGIYEETFPNDPTGVAFITFMGIGAPLTFILILLEIVYLQVFYLGLFRPNSKDAKAIDMGKEGTEAARQVVIQKLKDLGPMSFHEASVLVLFIVAVLLWIFRNPQVFPGWQNLITDTAVQDSAAAIFVLMLMFAIPSKPTFVKFFKKNEEDKPTSYSTGLTTWTVLNNKMPWGLTFLIGGGLALSDAARATGMGDMVAQWLDFLKKLDPVLILVIMVFFTTIVTQIISSNVAVANILMPIYSSIAQIARVHPLYVMFPNALACSMAFCLPISTPPNAIAAGPINMTSLDMIKVGIGMSIISAIVISMCFLFLYYIPLYWDLRKYPDFA